MSNMALDKIRPVILPLHCLPFADGPGGGVEVHPDLHQLPPVGGVRYQISLAVYLPEGILGGAVHLQLEHVDMRWGLYDHIGIENSR